MSHKPYSHLMALWMTNVSKTPNVCKTANLRIYVTVYRYKYLANFEMKVNTSQLLRRKNVR